MKKITVLVLVFALIFSLAGCIDDTSTTPQITVEEAYNAGKNLSNLLGEHENVYIQVTSNGKVIKEEFLSNKYYYSYQSDEFMNMGFEYSNFLTDSSEYIYFDNTHSLNVTLVPSGMIELTGCLSLVGSSSFISSQMVDNESTSITEKDGSIIVSCSADIDQIGTMGDDVVSCVETYTLDAKTKEMISVKTVYTYEDGTADEGIATITRDVQMPEAMQLFVAFAEESENVRTVTIISNPGTDNEKTDTVRLAKGLQISLCPDFTVEKSFTLYSDAACTQILEEYPDVNSDLTVYVKWDE